MRTEDSRRVIRIKTRELARQFQELTTRLTALRAEIARPELAPDRDPIARFTTLHRGLSDVLAQKTGGVFEDASYAAGVAEEIRCGSAHEDMVRAGTRRLEREIDCATRRTAAAVLYGRLFDETEGEVETTTHLAGREDALATLRGYWSARKAPPDLGELRALLEGCAGEVNAPGTPAEADAPAGGRGKDNAQAVLGAAVSPAEVRAHLHVLSHSYDHRPELRAYARRLIGDSGAVTDLAGALTILVREPNAWRWEDWPTQVRLRWNRTRWRAFLDPEIIPQLFLEAMALRLGVWARSSWLPRTIAARERKWDVFDYVRNNIASTLVLPGIGTTIQAYEQQAPNAYAGAGSITGEPDHFQRLFALLNADIWWHRAQQATGGATYVAQSDLQDFFPSLPHATVTTLLEVMGVPQPVIDFVVRYLRGPYQLELDLDGEAATTTTTTTTTQPPLEPQSGLFPGNTLSRVIADALLIALDAYVERTTRVPLTRFMDDLYWVASTPEAIAKTWEAIEQFCRVTGMRPNLEKTGAQRLGDDGPALPTTLPATSIRWGFLELSSGFSSPPERASSDWVPRQAAIDELATNLRERLQVPAPARQLVREYNAAIGYLVRGLSPLTALDIAHVERLHAPLRALHAELFGKGHGVVDVVRERLAVRHEELRDLVAALPHGWFYWPVTAGGLGLYNPASMLAGARAALATWESPLVLHALAQTQKPNADPRTDASWTSVYQMRATANVRLAPPTPSPEMAGRQRDFVARGGEVRGGTQAGLHPYWQWLLETHGPSLVEIFGTLRFLPTEVVPVDPIAGAASPQSLLQDQGGHSSIDDDIPF